MNVSLSDLVYILRPDIGVRVFDENGQMLVTFKKVGYRQQYSDSVVTDVIDIKPSNIDIRVLKAGNE